MRWNTRRRRASCTTSSEEEEGGTNQPTSACFAYWLTAPCVTGRVLTLFHPCTSIILLLNSCLALPRLLLSLSLFFFSFFQFFVLFLSFHKFRAILRSMIFFFFYVRKYWLPFWPSFFFVESFVAAPCEFVASTCVYYAAALTWCRSCACDCGSTINVFTIIPFACVCLSTFLFLYSLKIIYIPRTYIYIYIYRAPM